MSKNLLQRRKNAHTLRVRDVAEALAKEDGKPLAVETVHSMVRMGYLTATKDLRGRLVFDPEHIAAVKVMRDLRRKGMLPR